MKAWLHRWWLDVKGAPRILLSTEFWGHYIDFFRNRAKQISDDLEPLPASVNSLLPTFYPARVKFQVEFNRLARCMPLAYEDFTDQVFRQLSAGADPMEVLEQILIGEVL